MNINFRSFDWHDGRHGKNQCIVFGTLIPTDECFIWGELHLPHATYTTKMIVDAIAEKSRDLKFLFNLVDPYAHKIQSNVNTTVVEDMNYEFRELRRKGIGKGGIWETWDSKSVLGRERIKERLKNAADCKQPYNNLKVDECGAELYLPTMWIHRENCPNVRKSLGKWSTNKNGIPEQKNSHFCTAIEAIMKDIRFKARMNTEEFERHNPYAKYFHLK